MAQPQPEDALAAYARIQREADREILRALKQAFRETTRQLSVIARDGNRSLERQRVLAVRKALLEAQAEFYERAGNVIQRRRVEAAARAIQVSGRYDEAVFQRAGREEDLRAVSESLEETEAKAPEALVARLSPGGSRMQLSDRVYRTRAYTEGLLERRINSALARGLTAQEFAREVQDLVRPDTPGGVRFAALRLARTEINNAYHAMAIRAAELKPWVVGLEWHLSGSHSRPDECDALNGKEFKPPGDTPPKPHPQCMCYVTPIVGGDDGEAGDDAFLDDLVDGLFDDFIEEHGGRPAQEGPVAEATPDVPWTTVRVEGEATPAPDSQALPQATQGRNILDEILAELMALPTDPRTGRITGTHPLLEAAQESNKSPADLFLTAIARRQGYGLPRVADMDELDRLEAAGWANAYRGAQDFDGRLRYGRRGTPMTADEQMESLRYSEDFALGNGVYGNGAYFSADPRVAGQYGSGQQGTTEPDPDWGARLRAVISPGARLANWAQAHKEHDAWVEEQRAAGVPRDILSLFGDMGVWLAAQGYDGFIVEGMGDGAWFGDTESHALQHVIFNREVMVVERTNR